MGWQLITFDALKDVSNIPVQLCLCIWGSRCSLTRAYAPASLKTNANRAPEVISVFL